VACRPAGIRVFCRVNVAFINLKTYNKVICFGHVQQVAATADANVAVAAVAFSAGRRQ